MPWEITGTLDAESFLDDAVSNLILADDRPLPPMDSKLGHVDCYWQNVGGGQAYLETLGGSVDDRALARQVLAAQLAAHGFTEASVDFDGFEKTAHWNDVMAKAKRLLQTGAVQVLRNGINNIVAQVQGDHGQYQSEIFRQDPNSRAISGSDCECGWGQFQNTPRSRSFQKFQDRVCSHILAAFWQSQSMPLDEDANPQDPSAGGAGGGAGGAPPGGGAPPTMGPEADSGFDPAQRSFDPSMAQGQSAGPGAPPGGAEPPPAPSPADVLPQFQTPQPPPNSLVSDPALMPGPTPTSPVAMPPGGAYSSVRPNPWDSWHFADAGGGTSSYDDTPPPEPTPPPAAPLNNGDLVQLRYPDQGTQVGRSEAHGAGQPIDLTPGMVGEVRGVDPSTGMVEVLYMGGPFLQNKKMEPFGATAFHFPSYVIPRPDLKKPGPAIRRRR